MSHPSGGYGYSGTGSDHSGPNLQLSALAATMTNSGTSTKPSSSKNDPLRPIWPVTADHRYDLRPHNQYDYNTDSENHLNFNHNASIITYWTEWRCSPYPEKHGWTPSSGRTSLTALVKEELFNQVKERPVGWSGDWPCSTKVMHNYVKSAGQTLLDYHLTKDSSVPYDPQFAANFAGTTGKQPPAWLINAPVASAPPPPSYNAALGPGPYPSTMNSQYAHTPSYQAGGHGGYSDANPYGYSTAASGYSSAWSPYTPFQEQYPSGGAPAYPQQPYSAPQQSGSSQQDPPPGGYYGGDYTAPSNTGWGSGIGQ
ncbi:uncharacterized protein I303_101574 [Kwoniella dejecticola CBS 10117]|uniref:Uncharacterized protein n=1 Tax=Kwoniella dejecticola CBS 10117 TaxID=1296121 RepID=A0A1A6ADE4_9TREE|nr:uncharacterized protein I303_02293 [Kwoniella dejecticola CBS 10117]OBR88074.1 hypothetical protein I303_02293 [Kwoniella dejecticola CBS 10117]